MLQTQTNDIKLQMQSAIGAEIVGPSTSLQELQQYVGERSDFCASIVIPDSPFQFPEQRFTLHVTETSAVLENYPEDSWPKVIITLEAQSHSAPLKSKQLILDFSSDTAMGGVLWTRVLFVLTQVGRCLIPLPGSNTLAFGVASLIESEKQELLSRAKLFRRLGYLEEFFNLEFTVPDNIPRGEVQLIDVIFRGITEGEFPVWYEEFYFSQVVLPPNTDLSGPPFTSPGRFAYTRGEFGTLFGQTLKFGPTTILLEDAQLVNIDALEKIRAHPDEPVDLHFRLLDQRITYRFEKFAKQPRDQLKAQLKAFKANLRREEPEELVALLDESLTGPIRYPFLDALNEFAAEHSEFLRRLAE